MTILTANLRKQIVECEAQLESLREQGRFDSATFDDVQPARELLQNRLAGLRTTLADVLYAEGLRGRGRQQVPMSEWPRPFTFKDSDWTFPHRQNLTPEPEPSRWGTVATIILTVTGAAFMLLQCTGMLTK